MSTESDLKDLESIDWAVIADKIRTYCTSEAVKESLRLEPQKSAADASNKMTAVKNAEHVLAKGQRPYMESLDLSSVWLQRLKKGATLQPLEFKDVHHFCAETLALKSILGGSEILEFEYAAGELFDAEEPLSAIDQILTSDGGIRTDASETLYNLFNEKNKLARK